MFFFFHDTAPTETYPLSLHDALPISSSLGERSSIARAHAPRHASRHRNAWQDARKAGQAAACSPSFQPVSVPKSTGSSALMRGATEGGPGHGQAPSGSGSRTQPAIKAAAATKHQRKCSIIGFLGLRESVAQ